ncbi:MAG: DinB family protein [Phycisphaerales bacterium]|nr:DinB family protein [Phycisphaerales bacterium]
MNTDALVDRLESFATTLPGLVAGVTTDDACWRPKRNQWSILEIVNHMVDIETGDMRLRLSMTLDDPTKPWPAIDPQAWVKERRHNERDLDGSVLRFIAERNTSVDWLRTLDDPAWDNAYEHPKFGPMCAGDILAAWTAHDILHTRQICKRLFQLTKRDALPYSTDYAGTWIE